jgi:hypothetical protein
MTPISHLSHVAHVRTHLPFFTRTCIDNVFPFTYRHLDASQPTHVYASLVLTPPRPATALLMVQFAIGMFAGMQLAARNSAPRGARLASRRVSRPLAGA